MRLLFKQKLFSWFDSYDIFDEAGNTVYTVKGQPSWGHMFNIYDAYGNELGTVKQKLFSFFPYFELYMNGGFIGSISKRMSLFKPKYDIDFNGWYVEGNFWEYDYSIYGVTGSCVATVSKQLFNWTDTYAIDVYAPQNALCALMFVLAIDAEKCSRD